MKSMSLDERIRTTEKHITGLKIEKKHLQWLIEKAKRHLKRLKEEREDEK